MALHVQWTQYGQSAIDITDQAAFDTLSIEQNASGINAICRINIFTLLPFGEGQYTKRDFAIRDLIRIYDDSLSGDEQWLFSGFITSITPRQEGDVVHQEIEIADYTSIFDAVVIDDMTVGQKVGQITNAQVNTPSAGYITYTCDNDFAIGDLVTITGANSSEFNTSNNPIVGRNASSFYIQKSILSTNITGAQAETPGDGYTTYTSTNTLQAGDAVSVGNVTPSAFNFSGTVYSATPTAFVVAHTGAVASIFSVQPATPISTQVTYNTTAAHAFNVGDVVTVSSVTPTTLNVTSAPILSKTSTSFVVSKTVAGETVTNVQPNTPVNGQFTYTVSGTNDITSGKVSVTGVAPDEFNVSNLPVISGNATSFVVSKSTTPLTVTGAVPNGSSIVFSAANSLTAPYGKANITGISSGSGTSVLNVSGVAVTAATSSTVTVTSTAGYAAITNAAINSPSANQVTYTAANSFAVNDLVDITGISPSVLNHGNAQVIARSATTFTISKTVSSNTISDVTSGSGSVVYTSTGHNLSANGRVTITGVTPTQYNLTNQLVTSSTGNTFTVSNTAGQATITGVTTVSNASTHTLQFTATNAFSVGNIVDVTGISSGGTTSPLNITARTLTAAAAGSFTISDAVTPGSIGQYQLSAGVRNTPTTGQVTFTTTSAHALEAGQRVTITGVTNNTGFNLSNVSIISVNLATNQFVVAGSPTSTVPTFGTGSWVAVQWVSGGAATLDYVTGGSAAPLYGTGGAYAVDWVSGGSIASAYSSGGAATPAYDSGGKAVLQYASGGANADVYVSGGEAASQSANGVLDVEVIDEIFMHVDGVTGQTVWQAAGLNHQPTMFDYDYVLSDSAYLFSNPATYIVERYQGMTVHQALDAIVSKTGYSYWVDEALNFHYKKTKLRDIMTNGTASANTSGWSTAPSGTTFTRQNSGGPYGSGTYFKYTLTNTTGPQEIQYPLTPAGTLPDVYMVNFRYKSSSTDEGGADHMLYLKWYDASNNLIKTTQFQLNKNQSTWTKDWFLSQHSGSTPPASLKFCMSLGKSHSAVPRTDVVDITEIQIVPIDTTFGFLETNKSVLDHGDADAFTWASYENPETAIEGAQAKNVIRVYGAWEDAENHDVYNEYEHPQGIWALRGRKVYGNVFDQSVIDDVGASYRAAGTFEKEGIPLRTVGFDHEQQHYVLRTGDVIPFIWETGDISEPFLVRENSAKWEGTRLFWSTTLGGDPTITKTSLYAVNARLQELQQYLLDSIPPSPPPDVALTAGSVSIDADGNTSVPVTAEWLINNEPDFRSYKVQFSSGDSAPAALAFTDPIEQTISRRQFGNTGAPTTVSATTVAPAGKYIAARVAATDFMANASGASISPAVLTPQDNIPPSDPSGLLVTPTIASILISWDFDATLPGNRDFQQYSLQRVSSTTSTFPGWTHGSLATFTYENSSIAHPVTAEGGSATSENSVYNRYYWYRVAARDKSGNQSGWAYVDDLPTPTVDQGVRAGAISSLDIGSITADSITTGTLTLDGGEGVTITSDNFKVSANGIVDATTINVVASSIGPGIISSKGASAGDFAVPTNDTVQIGHWTAGNVANATITGVTLASPSTGYTRYTANNSFVEGSLVTISGCNPASFDEADVLVFSRTSTTFTIKVKKTGTYVSGGSAQAASTAGAFVSDLSINSTGVFTIGKASLDNTNIHTVNGKLNAVDGIQINGTDIGGGGTLAGGRVVAVELDPGTAGSGDKVGALEFYSGATGTIPGTFRARIRASDSTAGRIVVERTAGSDNAELLVDGNITATNITASGSYTFADLNVSTVLTGTVGGVNRAVMGNVTALGTASGVDAVFESPTQAGDYYKMRRQSFSSRKYKENIVQVGDEIAEMIKKIKVHYFNYKSGLEDADPDITMTGLIAEDVAVSGYNPGVTKICGEIEGWDTRGMIVGLMAWSDQQERRIQELEQRISSLESK